MRDPNGGFMTFQAPGAALQPGGGSSVSAINDFGVLTGFTLDATGAYHGFDRIEPGRFITYSAPGAGNQAGQGTFSESIDDLGITTGFSEDQNNLDHGFLELP